MLHLLFTLCCFLVGIAAGWVLHTEVLKGTTAPQADPPPEPASSPLDRQRELDNLYRGLAAQQHDYDRNTQTGFLALNGDTERRIKAIKKRIKELEG